MVRGQSADCPSDVAANLQLMLQGTSTKSQVTCNTIGVLWERVMANTVMKDIL